LSGGEAGCWCAEAYGSHDEAGVVADRRGDAVNLRRMRAAVVSDSFGHYGGELDVQLCVISPLTVSAFAGEIGWGRSAWIARDLIVG
jgi:hypothetical protein